MLGSMFSSGKKSCGNSGGRNPVELNALGRWFKRHGWKGELLKGVIMLAVVLALWFTGTWLLFLIICGVVWFVRALFS